MFSVNPSLDLEHFESSSRARSHVGLTLVPLMETVETLDVKTCRPASPSLSRSNEKRKSLDGDMENIIISVSHTGAGKKR